MSENDEQSKCPQCGGEKRYRALTCENCVREAIAGLRCEVSTDRGVRP